MCLSPSLTYAIPALRIPLVTCRPHLKSVSHSVHTKQVPFSNAMEQLEKSMATSNASSSASASTNGSAPATSPGVVVGSPALTGGPALASSPATGLVSSFTSVTVPTQSLSQVSQSKTCVIDHAV